MSATSRPLGGGTGVIVGRARTGKTAPDRSTVSSLYDLIATRSPIGTIARLTLGLVMFPHAAQKVFGWFGGYGIEGTYEFFTTKVGLPAVVAAGVIMMELLCSLLLIAGAFTRIAAAGIMTIMLGAIATTHVEHGFFMNWSGTQLGEGYEYHLLAIGLAVVTIIVGGGSWSVDRMLTKRLRLEVDPLAGKFMGGDGEPVSANILQPPPSLD